MTLAERVERLRMGRAHWHCVAMPNSRITELHVGYHHHPGIEGWWCKSAVGSTCTDFHGDPREAYLDALALMWELAPLVETKPPFVVRQLIEAAYMEEPR